MHTADCFSQQTTANAEQIRDIEERVRSFAKVLTSSVGDQDSGERLYGSSHFTPSRCPRVANLHLLFAGNWLELLQSSGHIFQNSTDF